MNVVKSLIFLKIDVEKNYDMISKNTKSAS